MKSFFLEIRKAFTLLRSYSSNQPNNPDSEAISQLSRLIPDVSQKLPACLLVTNLLSIQDIQN